MTITPLSKRTEAHKELDILRKRMIKLRKKAGYGFWVHMARELGLSPTAISLFWKGKKSFSIENYFTVKAWVDDFEKKIAEEKVKR